MSSALPGPITSTAEVTDIGPGGLWLLVDSQEHFLSFEAFPWFRSSSIQAIFRVERVGPDHLYWPDLDVDIHLESITNPAKFPLVASVGA